MKTVEVNSVETEYLINMVNYTNLDNFSQHILWGGYCLSDAQEGEA